MGGTWKHGGVLNDDEMPTRGTGGETYVMPISKSLLYSEERLEELAMEPPDKTPLQMAYGALRRRLGLEVSRRRY